MSYNESPTQQTAYLILDQAREQIKALPRFKGQAQVVQGLRRLLNYSIWYK